MGAKMVPYDTRLRIVDAYERRGNAREIADMFGVSKREVYRLVALKKKTGDVESQVHQRGRKPKMSPEQMEQIRATLEETPDITLLDLSDKLELPVSESRLCRIVRDMRYHYKKKVMHAAEQARPRRGQKA